MSDNSNNLGTTILIILTKHALKMVPVAGPYLELGADVLEAILQDSSKDLRDVIPGGQLLTIANLVAPLKGLPLEDAAKTVDAILASPEAMQQLSGLSPAEQAQLRQKLVNLPSTLRFLELRPRLLQMVEDENWDDASSVAQEMLCLMPTDEDTVRLDRIINAHCGRPWELFFGPSPAPGPGPVLYWWLLATVSLFTFHIFYFINDPDRNPLLTIFFAIFFAPWLGAGLGLILYFTSVFLHPILWPILPEFYKRIRRSIIMNVFAAILAAVFLGMFLGLFLFFASVYWPILPEFYKRMMKEYIQYIKDND
jgi:hypothetical protein